MAKSTYLVVVYISGRDFNYFEFYLLILRLLSMYQLEWVFDLHWHEHGELGNRGFH